MSQQISTQSSFVEEIFDLIDSSTSRRKAAELHALRIQQRRKLHAIYTQFLPKVVTGLIGDLLSREIEYKPGNAPMLVFTRKGTDPEKAREVGRGNNK